MKQLFTQWPGFQEQITVFEGGCGGSPRMQIIAQVTTAHPDLHHLVCDFPVSSICRYHSDSSPLTLTSYWMIQILFLRKRKRKINQKMMHWRSFYTDLEILVQEQLQEKFLGVELLGQGMFTFTMPNCPSVKMHQFTLPLMLDKSPYTLTNRGSQKTFLDVKSSHLSVSICISLNASEA